MPLPELTPAETFTIIVSISSIVGTFVLGVIQVLARPKRPKSQEEIDHADAASKLISSADVVVEMLKEQNQILREQHTADELQIDSIKCRIEKLEGEKRDLRIKIDHLENQVMRIPILEKENQQLKDENKTLRERVSKLEQLGAN